MTVRELRKKLGWTQIALARAVEVTQRTVMRWESGETAIRNPYVARLNVIAIAFGLEPITVNCPCCGRPL